MGKNITEAITLFKQGQFSSALELAKTVGRVSKDHALAQKLVADCHYNIGVTHLFQSGLVDEAQACFRQALQANPRHEEAANNLAGLLFGQGEISQAVLLYQQVLKINPNRASTVFDLAVCYERLDQMEKASGLYGQVTRLDPGDGAAAMRDALLVQSIIPAADYPAQVRQRMQTQLATLQQKDIRMAHPERKNGSYFYLSYHGLGNKTINEQIAQTYLHTTPTLAWTAAPLPRWKPDKGRIRIGFLSEHFCDHSIGRTSRGMVAQLDRQKFEVVVVHIGRPANDAVHQWINDHADSVFYASMQSLQAAREGIAGLQLDVVFWQDIGMSPFSYFLAYARLAAVQLTSFGHPDTTGIPNIDYYLSSSLYEPAHAQDDYSERLYTVPDAGTLSYYYRPGPPKPLQRADFGLPAQAHIYLCPQALFKIHPDMDALLNRISEQDEAACIVLIDQPSQAGMTARLLARIGASYPVLLAKIQCITSVRDPGSYLALLNCADVMLDTLHFNGQNTNLEAFSVGLPVVTLPTQLQRGRHTAGMYRAMGFEELVAQSADDYVVLACRLANDPEFARHCRERITGSCAVLYENAAFVRHLEDALSAMVLDTAAGLPGASA